MPLCRQVYVRPDTGLLSIPAEASFFVLVPVDAGVDAEIVFSFSYSQTHGWSVEVLDVQRLENTCMRHRGLHALRKFPSWPVCNSKDRFGGHNEDADGILASSTGKGGSGLH